jgi:hypothetical protein
VALRNPSTGFRADSQPVGSCSTGWAQLGVWGYASVIAMTHSFFCHGSNALKFCR